MNRLPYDKFPLLAIKGIHRIVQKASLQVALLNKRGL